MAARTSIETCRTADRTVVGLGATPRDTVSGPAAICCESRGGGYSKRAAATSLKEVTVETNCGVRACVNLDHLRVTRLSSALPTCRRGHELTAANVVRHRDGRIAYCRTCRNDRRRKLYQRDTV